MRGYTDIWVYSELRRGNIWVYSERNNTTTSTTFTPSDPSPMPPICGQVRGRTSGERTSRKVPVQWYKKVPCEGTDAAGVGGKCGGISAAKFSWCGRGYRMCMYMQ